MQVDITCEKLSKGDDTASEKSDQSIRKKPLKKSLDSLIIHAKTGKEAADWVPKLNAKEFQCKYTHVDAPSKSNNFEAAVIVANEQDDLDMMIDSLDRFALCPVVVFLGDIELPEEFPTCKQFSMENVADCAKYLHERIAEERAKVKEVFD